MDFPRAYRPARTAKQHETFPCTRMHTAYMFAAPYEQNILRHLRGISWAATKNAASRTTLAGYGSPIQRAYAPDIYEQDPTALERVRAHSILVVSAAIVPGRPSSRGFRCVPSAVLHDFDNTHPVYHVQHGACIPPESGPKRRSQSEILGAHDA